MLKPHNATILDLVNYLLQWFTHTKKNLLYLLQFWLVLEILVFCVDPSFSLMSLSLENFHISYKRDLLIFDSLSFCLSEELLFLHFWTLFHCVQILRNDSFFFFPFSIWNKPPGSPGLWWDCCCGSHFLFWCKAASPQWPLLAVSLLSTVPSDRTHSAT